MAVAAEVFLQRWTKIECRANQKLRFKTSDMEARGYREIFEYNSEKFQFRL